LTTENIKQYTIQHQEVKYDNEDILSAHSDSKFTLDKGLFDPSKMVKMRLLSKVSITPKNIRAEILTKGCLQENLILYFHGGGYV
jgi:hypothetical protein